MGRNERFSLSHSPWWIGFFFVNRKSLFNKYSLFGEQTDDKEEEEDRFNDDGIAFTSHWGWWATIFNLSESGLLSITGDKSVTDVNFITVLNYLEIQKDVQEIRQRQERIAMSRTKIR